MFKEEVDEYTLGQLNPISKTDLKFDGSKRLKHLTIKFNRIYDRKERIVELMGTVRDVTEQVNCNRNWLNQKKKPTVR